MENAKSNWNVLCNLDAHFNQEWLKFIESDPVHPITSSKPIERRTKRDRLIFVATEHNEPKAMVQIALCKAFPCSALDLWDPSIKEPPYEFAIFYSVFRLPGIQPLKGLAEHLINSAANRIHGATPSIKNFVTLSPIPSLAKHLAAASPWQDVWDYVRSNQDPVSRFHTNNGAKAIGVWPEADMCEQRVKESHGWMASYEYILAEQRQKASNPNLKNKVGWL